MNKQLIDYLDGQCAPAQRAMIEKKIQEDERWQQAYQQLTEVLSLVEDSQTPVPEASLRQDFEQFLAHEIRDQPQQTKLPISKTPFTSYLRYAAAAALLLLSVLTGMLLSRSDHQQEALATVQQDRKSVQPLITALQQESASKRLSGILHQAHAPQTAPDQTLLQALIRVLNQDDNANVRLAALQALLPYRDEPLVYQALLQSLVSQDDALVQITLIDVMVATRKPQVKESLQQIVRNETSTDLIKEEAQVGLFKL